MKQLRALWILTTKFANNGTTAVVRNYYGAMDPSACRIDLVTPNALPQDMLETLAKNGGRCFVLPDRNRRPLSYIRALAGIVRKGKYDVVHAHGNSATLFTEMLAAKRGGANVRIAHSHNTACTHNRLHRLLWPCFDKALTCRMACGQAAGAWLFHDRPFRVLNNAVDTSRFAFSDQDRLQVRQTLGLGEDTFLVGHAGLFTKRKNHAFLVDVFRSIHQVMPGARLLLIGSGETMEETAARAAGYGLADEVLFWGETDCVAPLFSAMDVFVLPSFSEGLPVTLVEAQSSGLCCVCADTVTRQSDMTNNVSFLSLSDAPEKWAKVILAMDAADRAEKSRIAREKITAAGYDIKANGAELLAVYRAQTERTT